MASGWSESLILHSIRQHALLLIKNTGCEGKRRGKGQHLALL